jgi:hypothetical protein
MLKVVLPLIGDSSVMQILRQHRDKSAKVAQKHLCGRRSLHCYSDLFTTLGTDHSMMDNDVIHFFVYYFYIPPAYNCTNLNPLLTPTWVKPEILGLTEQVESTNCYCTIN